MHSVGKKIHFIWFSLVMVLTGCAMNTFERREAEQTIPISKEAHLYLSQTWPQNAYGTYLQKIKANIKGEHYTLSVVLTLENQKLEAIAFNDVYGRLYHLIWTPQKISWSASERIKELMHPENIIADFLLTHLPLEHLKTALEGSQVREEGNFDRNTRIIESKMGIVRKISRQDPLGYLWKKVMIQNPDVGYELNIETVPLP